MGGASQHLSDGCGSAVGVFVVVFSEGAALQKIPLGVEQAAHAHASFAGVAWLARVQGVHWHLGGSGSRVAAFPQRRGISAGSLGRSHAGATAKAVAVRGYATESGFLYQLRAGLGSQLAVLLDEHVNGQDTHHFCHDEGEGAKVEGPAIGVGLFAVTLAWVTRVG